MQHTVCQGCTASCGFQDVLANISGGTCPYLRSHGRKYRDNLMNTTGKCMKPFVWYGRHTSVSTVALIAVAYCTLKGQDRQTQYKLQQTLFVTHMSQAVGGKHNYTRHYSVHSANPARDTHIIQLHSPTRVLAEAASFCAWHSLAAEPRTPLRCSPLPSPCQTGIESPPDKKDREPRWQHPRPDST